VEKTTEVGKYYYFFPQAVALIGVKTNIMPAAWHTPLSADPPLYGTAVSPKRHTYDLLLEETGFTVNFLDLQHAAVAAQTGSTSGRDIHKLQEFKIPYTTGDIVNGPVLKEAYAVYECKRYDVRDYGDHALFVGRIVLLHYRTEHLRKGQLIDEQTVKPMLYFGKDRYLTIDTKSLRILTKK
jgi:flavin reductase (DIM6/NTAB) family NADH-FMN oxidoreductase RutF